MLRAQAQAALFNIGADTVPFLIQALKDENGEVTEILDNLGKEAVPSLVQLLEGDKDKDIRRRIAKALGRIGPEAKEAVLALSQALKDDADVRYCAVEALKRISTPEALEAVK